MSFDRSFYPTTPSLQQSAQRAWEIRRLYRAGAVDRTAGLQSTDTIYTTTANEALRRLCRTLAGELAPMLKEPPRAQPGEVVPFRRLHRCRRGTGPAA